jgi:hypothetical protein
MNSQNANQFPDEAAVLVWYPLGANDEDRDAWAWLPGSIITRCGPEEWCIVVEVDLLGDPHPDDPDELLYPLCFRDASELRTVTEHAWWARRRELADG